MKQKLPSELFDEPEAIEPVVKDLKPRIVVSTQDRVKPYGKLAMLFVMIERLAISLNVNIEFREGDKVWVKQQKANSHLAKSKSTK